MLVDPAMITMLKELALPGQPDPAAEILQVFEADGRRMLGVLSQSASSHDVHGVHQAAHRMKGAAANLGAVALQERLFGLETVTGSGALPEDLDHEVDALRALFERSLVALRALVA